MAATPDVVSAAIAQIELGFAAFALKANAKVPITEHGFKNATRRADWIATQLAAPAAGNYGIVWPQDAERMVLAFDLDNGSDGRERPWQDRLFELIERIGPLPITKATTTPSGGRHAFYGWPADIPIPPGDELFGFTVRWPGRGYLVGPGSSIDGRPYVNGNTTTIADLPDAWVQAAVVEHTRRPTPEGLIVVTGGYDLPESIPSGRRYATVRDYVASRYNAGLSADELWDLVVTQVAPRFDVPKTEADLRADFGRVMAKIAERLGPPSRVISPEDAIAAVSPIEVRNLADIAVEAVEWVWHRYLPVGCVTLLDGNPGEGKSTIVADLIARLTCGTTWPDGMPVGPAGDVLYVTKEDDPGTQVRPRIEAAGGDVRRVNFVAADLLFPRDGGRFRELLDTLRPRLVLMDPLMSFLEGKVKVISDNEVRSAVMTPLGETAREMGCAILVIRHFNKTVGSSALLRGAGSLGGLAGSARLVLALTADPEDEDEKARVFGVVKSNYEAKPSSLKVVIEAAPVSGFQMTVSHAVWLGQSSTSVSDLMERTREEHRLVLDAEETLQELLERAGGSMPAADVHAAMQARKHSRNTVYGAYRALHIRADRVGFPSRTVWFLPTPLLVSSSRPDRKETTATERDDCDDCNAPVVSAIETTATTGTTGSGALARARRGRGTTGTTATTVAAEGPLLEEEDEREIGAESPVVPSRPVVPGASRPPARGRAREGWLRPCFDYNNHRFSHRQTPEGWLCVACYPVEETQ